MLLQSKQPLPGGGGSVKFGTHGLEWNPARSAGEQIDTFDPEHHETRIEARPGHPRADGRHRSADAWLEGRAASRASTEERCVPRDEARRFHQPGGHRGIEVEALALRNRQRARIRSTHHHDRNADAVETGHVGDPGDPHLRHKLAQTRDRCRRRHDCGAAEGMPLRFACAVAAELTQISERIRPKI